MSFIGWELENCENSKGRNFIYYPSSGLVHTAVIIVSYKLSLTLQSFHRRKVKVGLVDLALRFYRVLLEYVVTLSSRE